MSVLHRFRDVSTCSAYVTACDLEPVTLTFNSLQLRSDSSVTENDFLFTFAAFSVFGPFEILN